MDAGSVRCDCRIIHAGSVLLVTWNGQPGLPGNNDSSASLSGSLFFTVYNP
jgi:hypothetical protein